MSPRYSPRYRSALLVVALGWVAAGCSTSESSGPAVPPDTTPPQVLFTTPVDGGRALGDNAVIFVTFNEAIDPATLASSSFTLADSGGAPVPGAVVGAATGGTLTPASRLTPGASYTATVTSAVTDLAGNALAAPVSWTFVVAGSDDPVDTTAPQVLFTGPADGAQASPPNTRIAVAFAEAIDPATLDGSAFSLIDAGGAPVAGAVVAGTTGGTLTPAAALSYDATYTATVTTAVTDVAGNALAAPASWTFRTGRAPDTTAPTVTFTIPAYGQDGVAANTAVTVFFDEPIDPATVTPTSFRLLDSRDNPVSGTIVAYSTRATFTASHRLSLFTRYRAVVGTAVTDLAGNPLAAEHTWTFTVPDGAWGTAELLETNNAGGAQYAQVAVDARGNAVVVWTQFDGTRFDIWANRFTVGAGWGTAELIEFDNANSTSVPHVAVDPAGNAIAAWAKGSNVWANRYVVGVGWGTPELLEANAGPALSQHVALDPSGNAMVVWSQDDGGLYSVWANRYVVGVGWGTAELIEVDNSGHVAGSPRVGVDASGNAVAVWAHNDGTVDNVWANRYVVGVGWGTAELVEVNSGGAVSPELAVDPLGNAVAVWYQASSIWANRYVVGVGWGTAELIEFDNSGNAGLPHVAIDTSGNAVAVWSQFDGISRTDLLSNRYVAGVGWGSAKRIESIDGNAQDVRVAIDPLGNAMAVWVQDDGTWYSIWANRYTVGVGWGTAERLEFQNTGHAYKPGVAVGPTGTAAAAWHLGDGTRNNIWANVFE